MINIFLTILTISYASLGIFSLTAYIPTIRDIYKLKKQSANITSYKLWTMTTGITFLYSLFILDDFLFRVISFLNFAACLLVLVLSLNLKRASN